MTDPNDIEKWPTANLVSHLRYLRAARDELIQAGMSLGVEVGDLRIEINRLKAIAHEAIGIAYGGDLSISSYERLFDLRELVDNPNAPQRRDRCTCSSRSGAWHARGCACLPDGYDPQGDL